MVDAYACPRFRTFKRDKSLGHLYLRQLKVEFRLLRLCGTSLNQEARAVKERFFRYHGDAPKENELGHE
jgi:hypothetical protein